MAPKSTPSTQSADPRRQPDLYWKQLVQLKGACICIRLYRNGRAKWVRNVEVVKAVASSGGVAGWVVWRDIPFVWTSVIAAAQLLDAVKNVFPFAKQHRAASDLAVALEVIYIDAEDEWESVFAGNMSDVEITKRRTKLRKLQLEAERKHFPDGLDFSPKVVALAAEETDAYFRLTYGEDTAP